MTKEKALSLIQFQALYPTEAACCERLFQAKWPDGFRCPKCDHSQAYCIRTRKLPLYECVECGYQPSLTVDTVMENTRTDLRKWFLAIYLETQDKRGISAIYLAETIDVTYKTAWLMLHKIRNAMGQRDAQYQLASIVELDDAYFGAPTEGGKRGRGTEQTQVLVGVSLDPKGRPQYAKLEVIPDIKGVTLVDFARRCIKPGSTINSDAYRSFKALADKGYELQSMKFNVKENPDHLKWLHTIISNAKAFIGGTYHGLDPKHLQMYLNEFCYRFNRRKMKSRLFDHLLNLCASTSTITYSELTG